MMLSRKYILTIHLILALVLGATLLREWWRLEAAERVMLARRLEAEARTVLSVMPRLAPDARSSSDPGRSLNLRMPVANKDHWFLIGDRAGRWVWGTAQMGNRRKLLRLGEGTWTWNGPDGAYLLCVVGDDPRVLVAESTRSLVATVRGNLIELAAWYLVLGLLLAAGLYLATWFLVIRPIHRLSRAITQMRHGRLGVEVSTGGGDELDTLGREFNAMSRALAERDAADRHRLEIAHKVQVHWLPPPSLRLGSLEIAGRCLQAGAVGGDVYDVKPLLDGVIGVLVADVSGHDIAAALQAALVRSAVWHQAEQCRCPAEVLERVNRLLCHNLAEDHFASAFLALFDIRTGSVRWASAGHPPAILRQPQGELRMLTATGPVLGIDRMADFDRDEIQIRLGSELLIYTDGLIETFDPDGVAWGAGSVAEAFARLTADSPLDLVDRLIDSAAAFRSGAPTVDDLTVTIARFDPSPAERLPERDSSSDRLEEAVRSRAEALPRG